MRAYLISGALFTVLVLLFSCNTTYIKPPKPTNGNYTEPTKPTSGITLPITINVKAIAGDLNAQYSESYYSDNSFENNGTDNLKLDVLKRGALTIRAFGPYINMLAPMRIEGTYRIRKSVLGMNVTHDQGFKLNVTIEAQTMPTFDKDWNLKLNSKSSIRWEDLPNFEVAGIQVDFPKMFGKIMQGQVDRITSQLDKEIAQSVNLRKLVNENWKQLTQPISVDAATNSWLVVRPRQVFYTPLEGFDSLAKINLALYSVIEVVSGFKPAADTAKSLPVLYQTNKLSDKLNLMLNTEIPFEHINILISQQLSGKAVKLESKEYTLSIMDAKVFAHADKLFVGVQVNGKIKKGILSKRIRGVVYLEGIPVYDAQKQTISIKNFDFNLQTKDVLLKSASWLMNSSIFKKSIESKLEFSIAKELQDAKKIANEAVNKNYTKTLQLNGTINQIEPADIFVTPQSIRVNIKATGKIGVRLNGI